LIGQKKLLGQVQAEIQVEIVGGVLHIQLPGRRIQQARVRTSVKRSLQVLLLPVQVGPVDLLLSLEVVAGHHGHGVTSSGGVASVRAGPADGGKLESFIDDGEHLCFFYTWHEGRDV